MSNIISVDFKKGKVASPAVVATRSAYDTLAEIVGWIAVTIIGIAMIVVAICNISFFIPVIALGFIFAFISKHKKCS